MAEQRVQRRLAAILAADVVGYSRLMGEDEAGTLAQFKTLRKDLLDAKTAEHNGRVVTDENGAGSTVRTYSQRSPEASNLRTERS
ncbi:MAG: hypothetical protein O7H39_02590 [Gammaproteobacteria bacterium]|nr:hypothetical protein [Gammaproteobacteria bacterium]